MHTMFTNNLGIHSLIKTQTHLYIYTHIHTEALAQLAGILCLQMEGAEPGAVFFFAGADKIKWKRPVVPGDTLVMEVEIKMWRAKMGIAKATGRGYVDGQLAVEVGGMTFAIAK